MTKTQLKNKIRKIDIHWPKGDIHSDLIRRERQIALHNLTTDSFFQPLNDTNGPYSLELTIEQNRLIFRINNNKNKALPMLILSVKPYKRLIQDYFMIVNSYDEAISEGKPSRIEAIDMGRRALHNEGADLLIDRLKDKITMDLGTARRLFTLICALHAGKAVMWR